VVACIALAVLPRCGGDDDTAAPEPTTAGDQAARDDAEAERIAFHIYDFPSIWTVEGDIPDKTPIPESFNDCAGGAIPAAQISARRAVALRLNPAVAAVSQATLVKDGKLLDIRAASIATEEFTTCMQAKMLPVLQARAGGAPVPEIEATRTAIEIAEGTGVQVAMIASGPGGAGRHVYLDFVYLRRGRAEAVLAMYASPDRFPAIVAVAVTQAVTGRIQGTTG
jgi:hypothetical protein